MNQDFKIKLLVMAVIALALLNITTVVTILIQSPPQEINTFGKMSDELPKDYKNHFFTYYLDLDSIQIEELASINTKYMSSKKDLSKSVGVLTMELANKINNGCTPKEENSYYDSLIQLHKKMKYENYVYYTELRKMCNPQQKIRLDKFFSSILCIDHSLCSILTYQDGEPIINK